MKPKLLPLLLLLTLCALHHTLAADDPAPRTNERTISGGMPFAQLVERLKTASVREIDPHSVNLRVEFYDSDRKDAFYELAPGCVLAVSRAISTDRVTMLWIYSVDRRSTARPIGLARSILFEPDTSYIVHFQQSFRLPRTDE